MFIQLTKKDGSPVWINANFIVTVEPLRTGAIVVPVGDGLDYEVRESAEDIIPLVEGAADGGARVVPVTSHDVLSQQVAGEDEAPASPPPEPAAPPEPAPAPEFDSSATDAQASATPAEEAAAVAAFDAFKAASAPEGDKPKRTRRVRSKPVPAGTPATAGERKPPTRRRIRKTPLDLLPEQVERLRAMAPRSVKKTANVLKSQFRVDDGERTVRALAENGIIEVDEQGHVSWLEPPATAK